MSRLAAAYGLLDRVEATETPDLASYEITPPYVLAAEARCWLWLRPRKAIAMYETALREWPSERTRSRGVQQARLALACAAAGERDCAEAEGRKALAIARTTRSAVTARELRHLREALAAR